MQRTIDLPDDLANRLDIYLKSHPVETLADLVREALELKQEDKDPAMLLELAGIVTDAPFNSDEFAEDREV